MGTEGGENVCPAWTDVEVGFRADTLQATHVQSSNSDTVRSSRYRDGSYNVCVCACVYVCVCVCVCVRVCVDVWDGIGRHDAGMQPSLHIISKVLACVTITHMIPP